MKVWFRLLLVCHSFCFFHLMMQYQHLLFAITAATIMSHVEESYYFLNPSSFCHKVSHSHSLELKALLEYSSKARLLCVTEAIDFSWIHFCTQPMLWFDQREKWKLIRQPSLGWSSFGWKFFTTSSITM